MTTRYTYVEHQHRLASWAAATAARSSPKCRFSASDAVKVINRLEVRSFVEDPNLVSGSSNHFDHLHRRVCRQAIDLWGKHVSVPSNASTFTFGVAAKLVNVYLKVGVLTRSKKDGSEFKALHPPIDRILLKGLAQGDVGGLRKFWSTMASLGWSNFCEADYYNVIQALRSSVPRNVPLWTIEQYWPGYR